MKLKSHGLVAAGALVILAATLIVAGAFPFRSGIAAATPPGFDPGDAAAAEQAAGGDGRILQVISVGSVLTRDGMIWVYRPDKQTWLSVDEALKEEGRETHVLPLPVPATEIAQMQSFGFLLTKSGELWLYEFATDKWGRIQSPPAR